MCTTLVEKRCLVSRWTMSAGKVPTTKQAEQTQSWKEPGIWQGIFLRGWNIEQKYLRHARLFGKEYAWEAKILNKCIQKIFGKKPFWEDKISAKYFGNGRTGPSAEVIHAKSGRYLRYISAIFFGFSAKFRLRTRNQYCTQAIAWGSTI